MADLANTTANDIVCYSPTMITTNGIWQGDNPLDYSLPLFILQLTLVVVTTRILVFILKPFRQPRVIAEVMGGVILGPSMLGRSTTFSNAVFPLRSVMVIETMANIGLLYFLFLVGLGMDLSVIKRTGKKATAIAVAGMILPFSLAAVFSHFLHKQEQDMTRTSYTLFLGVALSTTAFPVLARILAELKLVSTELGRLAITSAIATDVCGWVLLAVAIAMAAKGSSSLTALWVILSYIAFLGVCFFIVRPAILWVVKNTPEGEAINDCYICLVLVGVMLSGFVTDAIGTHSVIGAFVFGLVIPNGPLGVALIEKLEDFISGLLLPLFFAMSGLKTNMAAINSSTTWIVLILLIVLACIGKVVGTIIVGFFFDMPIREAAALGLLMNTKGLVEMIVLNLGREQQVLNDETFAMMVLVTVIMTAGIVPLVTLVYKPLKSSVSYNRRTIDTSDEDVGFRVLVCVHTPRNVPTMISLLEASKPSETSQMFVYVLHLIELTGRAAMLIVHGNRKSGHPAGNRSEAQSDHIINAFENYEQETTAVSVQGLTAFSPYSTMHEDISNLAEEKHVALIIIPFHKQQTVDGGMETTNPAFRTLNQNLLANAPSSVGILVDRGLSRLNTNEAPHSIAVFFFGGPDDREALAYAWRMVQNPLVNLTVMHFVPGEEENESVKQQSTDSNDTKTLTVQIDDDKQLDQEYIAEFRKQHMDTNSVVYKDITVYNGEETISAIRSEMIEHDLIIVGRDQGMTSSITNGLTDWSECPELGATGDLLASGDFGATASILVVKQYVGNGAGEKGEGLQTSMRKENVDDVDFQETKQDQLLKGLESQEHDVELVEVPL